MLYWWKGNGITTHSVSEAHKRLFFLPVQVLYNLYTMRLLDGKHKSDVVTWPSKVYIALSAPPDLLFVDMRWRKKDGGLWTLRTEQ